MLRRKFIANVGTAVATTIASKVARAAESSQAPGLTGTVGSASAGGIYMHVTAPTQYVDTGKIRFAYRRFGKQQGVPLVFFQHFLGTMDNWDPAVTDGFAKEREVIIFDNAGISSSTGEVPTSIAQMANDASTFIAALGLTKVDVLGFSMGGLVAQQLTLDYPQLVRQLVLVGTGPQGGNHMATQTPESEKIFGAKYASVDDMWLAVFFTNSAASQAAGHNFIKRYRERTADRDPGLTDKVEHAQIAALSAWGAPKPDSYHYLQQIKQPTLVVNGDKDVIIYTVNSFILQQNLPNAKLIIYPDAAHGSLFQYPQIFVADVTTFLNN
jgi:pimeloyl-ACP methyl ester carboxylesterase